MKTFWRMWNSRAILFSCLEGRRLMLCNFRSTKMLVPWLIPPSLRRNSIFALNLITLRQGASQAQIRQIDSRSLRRRMRSTFKCGISSKLRVILREDMLKHLFGEGLEMGYGRGKRVNKYWHCHWEATFQHFFYLAIKQVGDDIAHARRVRTKGIWRGGKWVYLQMPSHLGRGMEGQETLCGRKVAERRHDVGVVALKKSILNWKPWKFTCSQ